MSRPRKSKIGMNIKRAKAANASGKIGRHASGHDPASHPHPDRRPKVSVPSAGAGALFDGGAPGPFPAIHGGLR